LESAGVTRNANVLQLLDGVQGENRPFWYGPYGRVRLLRQGWWENRRNLELAAYQRLLGLHDILV